MRAPIGRGRRGPDGPLLEKGGIGDGADDTARRRSLPIGEEYVTHLEKRLRIRPVGVVSKNDIGDRKMALAIFSCNFRDACAS